MYIEGLPVLKKKVLTLACINQQIMSGQKLYADDEKCNNPEIKTAVSLGLIKLIGLDKAAEKKALSSLKIRCVNISNKKIELTVINDTIIPGQKFHLTEAQIQDFSVRTAISSSLIRVEGAVDNNQKEIPITNIRLSSLLPEEVLAKAEEKDQSAPAISPKEITPAEQDTVKWNPSSAKPIKTTKPRKSSAKTSDKPEEKHNETETTTIEKISGRPETDTESKSAPVLAFDPNNEMTKKNKETVNVVMPQNKTVKFAPIKSVPFEDETPKNLQQNGELELGS